jgi:hypothetical protein
MADKRIQLLDGSDNVFPENPSPIRDTILAWKAIDGTTAAGNPHFELRNITNDSGIASLGFVFTDASGNNSFSRLFDYDGKRRFLLKEETLATASVTIPTSVTHTSSTTTIKCRRVGNVVTLYHNGVWKLSSSSANICTIPAGFRPLDEASIAIILVASGAVTGQARFRVYTSGVVQVYTSKTDMQEYNFICTYITSESYPS